MKYYMSGANNHHNRMNNSINNVGNQNNSGSMDMRSQVMTNHEAAEMDNFSEDMEVILDSDMMNSQTMNSENMGMSGKRRNSPNPPWPSMQPVVVMPPGSNTTSLGLPDANIYKNRLSVDMGDNQSRDNYDAVNADEMRNRNTMNRSINDYVSMGTMGMDTNMNSMNNPSSTNTGNSAMEMRNSNASMADMRNIHGMMPSGNAMNYRVSDMVRIRPPYMEDMTMTEYLMGRIGEYIKVDLCCGGVGNSKVGILREIGDDFIVLEDAESGNYMVCSMKGIQLIHVYDDGENE